jgi:hypothetical protein
MNIGCSADKIYSKIRLRFRSKSGCDNFKNTSKEANEEKRLIQDIQDGETWIKWNYTGFDADATAAREKTSDGNSQTGIPRIERKN